MTGYSFSTPVWDGSAWVTPVVAEVAATARTANGPEDQHRTAIAGWDHIDWRAQEERVRRLRQRGFKAAPEEDWAQGRNLPKLMVRSPPHTPVSGRPGGHAHPRRRGPGAERGGRATP